MHRSRTRSLLERWRRQLTAKRPYRCGACGWRYWSFDIGPYFDATRRDEAARAIAADPPSPAWSATVEPAPRPLPALDLDALDRLTTRRRDREAD